jgi:hypothetical protein
VSRTIAAAIACASPTARVRLDALGRSSITASRVEANMVESSGTSVLNVAGLLGLAAVSGE